MNYQPQRDFFAAEQEDRSITSSRGIGDNLVISAGDLKPHAPVHERRHYSEDDKQRARALLATPDLIWPIPVVQIDDRFYSVDSTCVIAAIASEDPEFLLKMRIVTEMEAWAIRHGHYRSQFKKEPMALARRALLMTQADLTHAQIAAIVGCKESRISQLVSAAKREHQFRNLKAVILEPERIPIRFWEELHATIRNRHEADEKSPIKEGPSRTEDFKSRARELVESGALWRIEEVRQRLSLVASRNPKARRARKLGEPVTIPASSLKLFVKRDRLGGAVLNLPQELAPKMVDEVVHAVREMLRGQTGEV